jgi:hypothetical protein
VFPNHLNYTWEYSALKNFGAMFDLWLTFIFKRTVLQSIIEKCLVSVGEWRLWEGWGAQSEPYSEFSLQLYWVGFVYSTRFLLEGLVGQCYYTYFHHSSFIS